MKTVTDVARMQFRSISAPDQYGIMALSDDGTFRLVPSDEFRDEMARLEEVALQRSKTFGLGAGIALITLGAVAIGLGWLAGRVFGKLGSRLSEPHPVSDVRMTRDAGGAVRIILKGLESRFQTVQMAWNPDEFLQPEAEAFLAKLHEMQQRETSSETAPTE
jgi:hypothetical protein